MDLRYSGEVTLAIAFVPAGRGAQGRGSHYLVTVKGPRFRTSYSLPAGSPSKDPAVVDRIALDVLHVAVRQAAGKGKDIQPARQDGRLVIRRTFQSPCPVRDPKGRIRLVRG